MSWWQTVLTVLGSSWVGWKTLGRLAKEIIDPPWVVRVRGAGRYRFVDTEESAAVRVALVRRWRDGSYNSNHVVIGTLTMTDEDFDEKMLDLRDKAKERARQLNRMKGIVAT